MKMLVLASIISCFLLIDLSDLSSGVFSNKILETEEIKKGIVIIEINGEAKGAGFLITKDGYILTAKHVLDRSLIVNAKFFNQTSSQTARVIDAHNHFDLALIKIDTAIPFSPLTIGDSTSVKASDQLTIIGHPKKEGNATYFEDATLLVQAIDNVGRIILAGSLYPGNSGGPALNKFGEVIGIAIERSERTSETYVFPIHYANHFLSKIGLNIDPGKKADYTSELETVKKKLDDYEKILKWLRFDLVWDVNVTTNKKLVRDQQIETRDLEVSYRKKFLDQYTPDDQVYMRIYPVFKGANFSKKKWDERYLYISAVRKFYQTNITTITDLDSVISAKIMEYNEAHKENYGVKDIDRLVIELSMTTENGTNKYPAITLLVVYE